jgi:hypothetical protein
LELCLSHSHGGIVRTDDVGEARSCWWHDVCARDCDRLVDDEDVVAEAVIRRVHVEVAIQSHDTEFRIADRAGVAVDILTPVGQRLRYRWRRYALVRRAVEVAVRETSLEVTVLLRWFANPARRTTPSGIG